MHAAPDMTAEPVKFLLVDDDDDNLAVLEELLERDGLQVFTARSGAAALELLGKHEFALALLDVTMPDMNGFDLAERIRGSERTRHVPIIFLTGAREPKLMFKGYDKGAVDVLHKPVDPLVLRSKADVFYELYRQRRDLQDALKLNELFVGILTHDLRNPLSGLSTGIQLLKMRLQGPAEQKSLDRMQQAAARMTEMLKQMVDLTRARLGGGIGFMRSRQDCDVAVLVRRAADELHLAHPERELQVEAAGDCALQGDPDRLLQVFSNLLSNAFNRGAAGSPVTVRVGGREGDVEVQIQSAGVIPREELPTLFDPFRARQKSRPANGDGLGLGLFIAQQILQAHGGQVSVRSTRESGTTFTAVLPRRVEAQRSAPGQRRQVLIVDDDADVRDALFDAFEHEGYAAAAAANGQEALTMLSDGRRRPDVVILDMVMPVVDGKNVYQAMQADPELKKIPVIVSTSVPQGAPEGAVVVQKPASVDTLLHAVAGLWR